MARALGSGNLQAQTIIAMDGPSVVVPDAAFLFSAEFIRSGDDLWLQIEIPDSNKHRSGDTSH